MSKQRKQRLIATIVLSITVGILLSTAILDIAGGFVSVWASVLEIIAALFFGTTVILNYHELIKGE